MELCSLHPFDLQFVRAYVEAVIDRGDFAVVAGVDPRWSQLIMETARRGLPRAERGDEEGANALTYGLAQFLATVQPTFFCPGVCLTSWEARIDRGLGMLMRPPSRLFIDAGLDVTAARAMPIRLDLSRGMMGGAFVPARLMPDFERLLDKRLERLVRRLIDVELDGVSVMGLVIEAVRYAREQGLGLYEAIDVITPDAPEAVPPGARVIVADRKRLDPALRHRLEEAAKPPKKPGLIRRMLGRGRQPPDGRLPHPNGDHR